MITDRIKGLVATNNKKILAELENLARAEYVYTVNKDDGVKLGKIFTPDEIQLLKGHEAREDTGYKEMV